MEKMPPEWFAKNERMNATLSPRQGMTLIDPWGERSVIIKVESQDGLHGVIISLAQDGQQKHYTMSGWQRNYRLRNSNVG